MSQKSENDDFVFAVPRGVPKRKKVTVKNCDLNSQFSSLSLSKSSSFCFKTPSYNENLDSAFQSVATQSSSEKSESSEPDMSAYLLKDTRPWRRAKPRSLAKVSGLWKLGSVDMKRKKSINYSKNWMADKFAKNPSFEKEYQEFIAPLLRNPAKFDLGANPPVGDLFDKNQDQESIAASDATVTKSSKDSDDLDITPPVGDLFDDEDDDQDHPDGSKNKDSVDMDITPPVGDLFDEDEDCEKEAFDLDKTLPVGGLFSDDHDLRDITPPVSPSLSFGDDDFTFDTWKMYNSDGVILNNGQDDAEDPRESVGASRVVHVLPGDDQVMLTFSL